MRLWRLASRLRLKWPPRQVRWQELRSSRRGSRSRFIGGTDTSESGHLLSGRDAERSGPSQATLLDGSSGSALRNWAAQDHPHLSSELAICVRRLCLAFPEAEEFVSHGMPNYRVRGGRVFATYAVNHHGDGRIALWLNTPEGMQDAYVRAESKHFFVPQYVGPRGWLGVRLDTGLAWKRIVQVVRAAY